MASRTSLTRRIGGAFALLLAAAVATLVGPAPSDVRAQDGGPRPAPARTDDDVPPPSRVYIPFEDLKKVFEQEGKGVFVPYAEFRDLWRKAMDRGPDTAPPSGVSSALYEGTVDGDLAVVEATLEVQSGSDGESAVPVGLAGATIGSATLDGKPAVIVSDKKGRRVVVRGKGPHTLKVTLVAAVLPKDGDRTVAFPSAGAPVSRLSFAVPGEGVRVTVEPNLATTRTDEGSGVTRVMAYVGAAPEVRLTWRPKPVEQAGAAAIVQAQSEVLHRVGEQTVETRLFVRFWMLRGGARAFRVAFPATERVLQVEGAGIRSWEESDAVVNGASGRELRVELHNDAEGSYDLSVLFERPRTAGDTVAELPTLTFPGTSREAGTIAVQVLPPVAVRPATVEGLYRVPTDETSEWMRAAKPLTPGVTVLAWRYAGAARRLSVSVETVAPEISVGERTVLDITSGAAVLRAALDLVVERAGLFQARVSMPEGWELQSAQVQDGATMRAVDARVEGEGAARHVLLDLGARRQGAVPIFLVLRRALVIGTDGPAGDAGQTLALPVLIVDGVARSRGVFAVAADEAFDVRTGALTGFVPAEPAVLAAANLPADPAQPRAVLFGFRHAGEARSGTLTIVRRKPLVVAEAVTLAGVEEDRLHVRHSIRFVVRYAGVDTFRFALPKSVADRVRLDGGAVKEHTRAPDTTDADRVVHTVVFQSPVLGETVLRVEYDLPQEPLAVGGARQLEVPALQVLGVEREQGWYEVTRDPALSVEGTGKGLIYADAREIPAWARSADAFLAWRRLSQPHGLTLQVAKHQAVPILQAVVNALALDTLVGGGTVALTEVRMDVQVNGLQFLRVELPAGAQVESAEVDGRPVSPRIEKNALLLPCPPGKSRDDRFGVRLVYREDAPDAAGRWFNVNLIAPRVPDALMQATAWTTWVPPDATLFSGGGNLRPAASWGVFDAVLTSLSQAYGQSQKDGRPTVRSGALPPQVTLSVAGRVAFSFQRTGDDARLEARFVPDLATGAIAVVCGVAVLALGWMLTRRGVAPALTALATFAVAVALYPSAAPGMRPALAAVAMAAVLLAAFCGLRSAWRKRCDARRVGATADAAVAPAAATPAPSERQP
ncbi:MAG: hypothetical protein K8T90_08640 [Planctomycetes bacterium]|nr:hypothetical protein [Planctomycetota bacterium]